MGKNSIISLKEVIDGTLQMEMCSASECISMKLHKKHCEPINELGEILFDIYNYYNENTETDVSESLYLFWECDSYQYSLEFVLNPDQTITINVSYCPDIFAGIHTESELQLSVQTNLKGLMENMLDEMKKILLTYGFVGYRKRWQQQDFPVATFLKLYNILNGRHQEPTSLPRCLECLQKMVSKEFIFIDN